MSREPRKITPQYLSSMLGIGCRKCGCKLFTTHVEPLVGERVRRRRICDHCGFQMVTIEVPRDQLPDKNGKSGEKTRTGH